jgi:hypothetical protein
VIRVINYWERIMSDKAQKAADKAKKAAGSIGDLPIGGVPLLADEAQKAAADKAKKKADKAKKKDD